MPISIAFAAMKGQKGSAPSKQTFATDQVPTTSHVSSNLRTRNKHSKENELFRIDRMNTAEFDNLLGCGPTSDVINGKKKLAENKKVESSLKLNAILQINTQVMNMRENSNSSEPNGHVSEEVESENKLDKTLPLDDPSLDDVSNGNHSEAKLANNNPIQTLTKEDNASQVLSDKQTPATVSQPPAENKDAGVQTEPVLVGCSCQRCQAIFDGVKLLVNAAETNECQFSKTSEEGSNIHLTGLGGLLSSTSGHEKHDTPLFVGSTIMLSATDKAMLKDLNPMDDDPKDFVNLIMDNLYTPETMSHMSAMGRTENSIKMDPTIFKQIFAYLKHKFKDTDITIRKSTVVNLVNAKCYAMRRQCWGKMRKSGALPENNDNSTSSSIPARAPLQKKTRNPNNPSQKDSSKFKRKKTDASEEMMSKSDKRRKEDNGTRKEKKQKNGDEEKSGEERRVSRERSSAKERKGGERSGKEERKDRERSGKEERKDRERSGKKERKERERSSKEERKERERSSDVGKKERGKGSEKEVSGREAKKPRLFQSDASKHFPYSPLKARKSPTKKSRCVSPLKKNSKNNNSGEVSTSTPKFGGKRPKPFPELIEMTYNQNSKQDSFELEDEELKDDDNSMDLQDSEGSTSQDSTSRESRDSDDSSMHVIESD